MALCDSTPRKIRTRLLSWQGRGSCRSRRPLQHQLPAWLRPALPARPSRGVPSPGSCCSCALSHAAGARCQLAPSAPAWQCIAPIRHKPEGPVSCILEHSSFNPKMTGLCLHEVQLMANGIESAPMICKCPVMTSMHWSFCQLVRSFLLPGWRCGPAWQSPRPQHPLQWLHEVSHCACELQCAAWTCMQHAC